MIEVQFQVGEEEEKRREEVTNIVPVIEKRGTSLHQNDVVVSWTFFFDCRFEEKENFCFNNGSKKLKTFPVP